jgi:hypothetical protein
VGRKRTKAISNQLKGIGTTFHCGMYTVILLSTSFKDFFKISAFGLGFPKLDL